MSRLDEGDDDDASCHSEFTPFGYELAAQQWYWPRATKETLAEAMQDHPTGTFAVRDASTPGQYTLTVRVGAANKLVKILVVDGRVGFTMRTLDFDAVVDLVDYYRHCSLEEHNNSLRTSLRFPLLRDENASASNGANESNANGGGGGRPSKSRVRSPSLTRKNGATSERSPQRRRPASEQQHAPSTRASSTSEVAEESLIPARISRTIAEAQKNGAKVDEHHRSTALVLRHLLEGLVAGACRTQRRHAIIQQQLEALDAELEQHTRALLGYTSVEALLADNRAIAESSTSAPTTLGGGGEAASAALTAETSDENRASKVADLLAKSVILHAEKMTRIETMKAAATTSAAQIRQMLEELQAEDATITRRLAAIKEHCARYTKELLACGVDRAFIERTHAYIQRATRAESDALLQSLLRVTLVTSPFDWLTTKSNKAYAESIVRACVRLLKARRVERTDGVFLIRPSATRANCYALVISAGDGDEIYNCLIEYCEPPPQQSANAAAAAASTSAAGVACESFGYAFANTQLFYATLCDFVRYYSLVTLREHNEQLDTVLRIPALRYLATVKKCNKTKTKKAATRISMKWRYSLISNLTPLIDAAAATKTTTTMKAKATRTAKNARTRR